ncbi:MAG TPA: GNAT family N-acetyltransferase [Solirubrobacterales bacterium]|nr:GNAT family N-acetyltransferase [Solirubrobacterales bacterium]
MSETEPKAEFEIVTADADRLDEIEPIWRSLSDHHAELTPAELPVRPSAEGWPLRRERYERSLAGGAALLIAQDDEGAIGYALAHPTTATVNLAVDRVLEVETVAVLPAARGAGVGGALMDAVRGVAAELGVEHLQLAVRTANEGALRFYERQGFAPLYVTLTARRTAGEPW